MKKFTRAATVFAGVALVLLAYSVSVFAQYQTGTLRGTVTDPNGQVVAGATVTAKNQNSGVTVSNTTNGEGLFTIPDLVPGKYAITIETTSGFSRKVVNDVDVPIGQITTITVALAVGAPTETVTVTSTNEEISVNREQSQISNTFETRKIEELPSNGAAGGIDTLALLAPGVIANRVGGTNTNGTGLSVNGNRGRSNNFQIDGSDNNDLSVGGPSLFVDNQSQVAEFQIITNNFSAQYGRNQGAVINIVTKQGGNAFHGDLSIYHQDQRNLDSLNNIEKASGQIYPNRNLYNVFGGTVGGPVWLPKFGEGGKSIWKGKDRAFFFFSYQGVRNPAIFTTSSSSLAVLPSDYSRLLAAFPGNAPISDLVNLGAFNSPLGVVYPRRDVGTGFASALNLSATGSCPKAIAVGTTPPAGCGTYTAYVNPATGQPFLTGGPYDALNFGTIASPNLFQGAQYSRDIPEPFTEDEWSMRFDVKASKKDNIDFRYLYQNQNFVNAEGTANGFSDDVPAVSKNLGGTWTRQISNNKVNEFKITYQALNVLFGGGDASLGNFLIPSPDKIQNTVANIGFGALGVTKTSTLNPIGGATNLPQGRLVTVYQYADNLTYTRGRQSFIFGAEYKHLVNLVPFLPTFQGAFSFSNSSNSLARLINDTPFTASVTAGNPLTSYTENDQYYFVQDDFKMRSNLTLNLGVRYEYTGQPINELNDQTTARENNAATRFWDPTLPLSVRTTPIIPAQKHNFAPRVGFAYSPKFEKGFLHKMFGEDATVLRGGFSIAYDPAFYNILLNLQNVAPYSVSIALNTTNGLPTNPALLSPFPLPGGIPTATVVQAGATASGLLPLGHLNPLMLTQTTVAPDFRDPYSEQWSFGLQHQINRNNVFEVRYVGTHGVALFQNVNGNFFDAPIVNGFSRVIQGVTYNFPAFPNLVPAGLTAQVCIDNPATPFVNEGACNGRQHPQSSLTIRANTAQSIYHSLQSQYTGRFLKSVTFHASYTWSKTIDNASEIFAFGDISSANAENPYCIGKCERSLSDLDRPHAFSTDFLYDVPFGKGQHGFVGHLIGGWQVNGVYVLTSGAPYTPAEATNGAYGLGGTYLTSGDRPFLANSSVDPRLVGINQLDAAVVFGNFCTVTNPNGFFSVNGIQSTGACNSVGVNDVHFIVAGPGAARVFGTPFGTAQRNSLRGPALNQLNASVFKNTRIGERLTVQFRAEAFNVLNHPNPGFGTFGTGGFLPNITVENAGLPGGGFGNFSDISLDRRVIQFGLRIIF
jgi:outer membrane receptor protein involved in Fe transport